MVIFDAQMVHVWGHTMFAVAIVNVVTVRMNKTAVSVTVAAVCILHSQKLEEYNFQSFIVFLYNLQILSLLKVNEWGMVDNLLATYQNSITT